jgi:hypothetical protein
MALKLIGPMPGTVGANRPKQPSQSGEVLRRDHLVEAKLIKELPLISILPPHHRRRLL